MNVSRATQRECDHAAGDRRIAQAIDENEPAHLAIIGVSIKRNRAIERNVAKSDLVEIEMLGGDLLKSC